jgi:hypothetical protein
VEYRAFAVTRLPLLNQYPSLKLDDLGGFGMGRDDGVYFHCRRLGLRDWRDRSVGSRELVRASFVVRGDVSVRVLS